MIELDSNSNPKSNFDNEVEDDSASRSAFWRWIVWAIVTCAFFLFVGAMTIPTRLGVEAPMFDKRGRERVWRVWWRARHEITDFGRQDLFVVFFLGLAIAFVVLAIVCVWIALVPEERSHRTATEMYPPSPV